MRTKNGNYSTRIKVWLYDDLNDTEQEVLVTKLNYYGGFKGDWIEPSEPASISVVEAEYVGGPQDGHDIEEESVFDIIEDENMDLFVEFFRTE